MELKKKGEVVVPVEEEIEEEVEEEIKPEEEVEEPVEEEITEQEGERVSFGANMLAAAGNIIGSIYFKVVAIIILAALFVLLLSQTRILYYIIGYLRRFFRKIFGKISRIRKKGK